MPVSLVYETHSWTTDNENGFASGWLPGRLAPYGVEQAHLLGERRRDVDVVVVSDLARAVETARVAFGGRNVDVVEDPRLRECDYGDLNGAPVAEVGALRVSRVEEPFPNGQSYRDVARQTRDLLRDLRAWEGDRVLLIGHSANKLALDHLLLGRPLAELVAAPFAWREGWEYVLPDGWV